MSTDREPDPPLDKLTHAAGLTEADIDSLEAFLRERFDTMWQGHPDGIHSDAYRASRALEEVLENRVEPVRASFRYDDGSEELLLARMRHWNRLYDLARSWRQADGFDQARWTHLVHRNAEDVESAVKYERQRELERAASARERLLRSM